MKLKIINISVVLFVIGTVIPAISLADYLNISSERQVFKGLGVVFIFSSLAILLLTRRYKLKNYNLQITLLALTLPFIFALSATIYDFESSLVQWLRFITVIFILLFLSLLTEEELIYALRIYCYLALILALISLFQYFTGYPKYEKFPVINIRSNKSIIFEQNVFALYTYMSFLIYGLISIDNKNILWRGLVNLSYLFGIFISFYRTVYAFMILRFAFKHLLLSFSLLFLMATMWLSYFYNVGSILSEILKLEQAATLTGRNILWTIALEAFYSAPIIGLGENAIPDFSNAILNRNPPYTTYHSVIFDVLAISGILGFLAFTFLFIYIFFSIRSDHRFLYLMLIAPSLLNTYYAFMPNPLGGILGVFIFYSIASKQNNIHYEKTTSS